MIQGMWLSIDDPRSVTLDRWSKICDSRWTTLNGWLSMDESEWWGQKNRGREDLAWSEVSTRLEFANFYWTLSQGFSNIGALPTLMLRTTSSTRSSENSIPTAVAVEDDEGSGAGGHEWWMDWPRSEYIKKSLKASSTLTIIDAEVVSRELLGRWRELRLFVSMSRRRFLWSVSTRTSCLQPSR